MQSHVFSSGTYILLQWTGDLLKGAVSPNDLDILYSVSISLYMREYI